MNKLNKKLLEFAGFKYDPLKCDCLVCRNSSWIAPDARKFPDGTYAHTRPPDFLNDLKAGFEHLVSLIIKHNDYFLLTYNRDIRKWYCQVGLQSAIAETPTLALCLAIEKLKKEKK